jgi:hypothetical protein
MTKDHLSILAGMTSSQQCYPWRRQDLDHGVSQFLVKYHNLFAEVSSRSKGTQLYVSSWVAPKEGKIKVNVDAGWDTASKQGGLGIIIQDHHCQVILSEWKLIPFCTSTEEAEILDCLEGLWHLIHLRRWPAILESDCLRAVQAISSEANE